MSSPSHVSPSPSHVTITRVTITITCHHHTFHHHHQGVQEVVNHARTLNYFEHIGDYVTQMCNLSCKYRVKIVPDYMAISLALKVSEGVSLALDPAVEMGKVAVPVIMQKQASDMMKKARAMIT